MNGNAQPSLGGLETPMGQPTSRRLDYCPAFGAKIVFSLEFWFSFRGFEGPYVFLGTSLCVFFFVFVLFRTRIRTEKGARDSQPTAIHSTFIKKCSLLAGPNLMLFRHFEDTVSLSFFLLAC